MRPAIVVVTDPASTPGTRWTRKIRPKPHITHTWCVAVLCGSIEKPFPSPALRCFWVSQPPSPVQNDAT